MNLMFETRIDKLTLHDQYFINLASVKNGLMCFSIKTTQKKHIYCMHLKNRIIRKSCVDQQYNDNCTKHNLLSVQPD